GLLAIFPIATETDAGSVCRRAFSAALDARQRISTMTAPAGYAGGNAVRFGLALHTGEVMYGNIGGGNRLDFTCIGPAVNLAAPLEKGAAKLRATILASAGFAPPPPGEFVHPREIPLARLAAPPKVYRPPQVSCP